MKITCHCGHLLIDSSDGHSHKAHLIPDQSWLGIFDLLDENVIAPLRARLLAEEGASMRARKFISQPARVMYQCPECGRVYINDAEGQLHCYVPADPETSKEILRATE